MSGDTYLRSLLLKYSVDADGAETAGVKLNPTIARWSNGNLSRAYFSGSLAKGTWISLGTDADVFLSLSSVTPGTLSHMYESLFQSLTADGYVSRRQNVSIGVRIDGFSIDLVPGKRQSHYGNVHSLYRSKADSWTQTDVNSHISTVKGCGRIEEIRVLKIWKYRHGLSFSSFFLELAVIEALKHRPRENLANNVWAVLEHLRDRIQSARYVAPANTNNIVSDDCTVAEKATITRGWNKSQNATAF
ncbi:hypothetical protein BGP75_08915 [Motiliproteus sp. MSK22-1]|nr:hypothetical protein BGP75_08915 [Motiliproteus sp. MSK22-1]